MKIPHLELLSDVIVMAAVDGRGVYQPLPKDSLNRKIEGELAQLIRDGEINFIVVAATQKDNENNGYGLPAIPRQCTLIEAEDFADLLTQLENQGGRLGMELRRVAGEDFSALRLPLRHVADKDWDQLYQVPRLREMKVVTGSRIRPSQERNEISTDIQEDRTRPPGLYEWEEVLDTDKLTIDRDVEADELLDSLCSHRGLYPQSIVIGPPGSGKSSFLGWLARKMASHKEGTRPFPLLIKLPFWEKAWSKADKDDDSCTLLDYLTSLTGIIAPDEQEDKRRRFLQNWLANGRLALLFDGLDEIGDTFFDEFVAEIKRLSDKTRFVVSCRTVWQRRYEALNLPLLYLAGLSAPQRDSYIEAFPWDEEGGEKRREELISHLPQAPGVATLATNPQMLSFLCHTVNWDPDLPLPLVRVELISAMLRSMLEKPPVGKRKPQRQLAKDFDKEADEVIDWLGKIAFDLFTGSQTRELVFSRTRLGTLFDKAHGEKNSGLRKCFINEMSWRGILRSHPKGFFFFHLFVQEFLVAHALAGLIEDDGFEADLTFSGETKSLGEWLYDWSLEQRWEEIMLLTAGLLEEPAGYLDHISNEICDTLFRHRLALAARMTGEISKSRFVDTKVSTSKSAKLILDKVKTIFIASDNIGAQHIILSIFIEVAPVLLRRPDNQNQIDNQFYKHLKFRENFTHIQMLELSFLLSSVNDSYQLLYSSFIQIGKDDRETSLVSEYEYAKNLISETTKKLQTLATENEIIECALEKVREKENFYACSGDKKTERFFQIVNVIICEYSGSREFCRENVYGEMLPYSINETMPQNNKVKKLQIITIDELLRKIRHGPSKEDCYHSALAIASKFEPSNSKAILDGLLYNLSHPLAAPVEEGSGIPDNLQADTNVVRLAPLISFAWIGEAAARPDIVILLIKHLNSAYDPRVSNASAIAIKMMGRKAYDMDHIWPFVSKQMCHGHLEKLNLDKNYFKSHPEQGYFYYSNVFNQYLTVIHALSGLGKAADREPITQALEKLVKKPKNKTWTVTKKILLFLIGCDVSRSDRPSPTDQISQAASDALVRIRLGSKEYVSPSMIQASEADILLRTK